MAFAANYYQTVVTAILPDRVAAEHRGFVAGAIALGVPVGIFEGVNIATASPAMRPWLRSFRDRDFTLAFVSRFLLFLAYFTVAGYLFYVMQDYVGRANLPGRDAARAVSLVLSLVTVAWLIVTPLTAVIADRLGHTAGVVGVVSILIGLVCWCLRCRAAGPRRWCSASERGSRSASTSPST